MERQSTTLMQLKQDLLKRYDLTEDGYKKNLESAEQKSVRAQDSF